ncbi:hypothetical protein ACFFX0_30785 [Citricoccus parietis]|uniref:Uncharacterized protein n=1 Tax=Citricoccus parietis TaxID=592307 RepID=A0ABV5G8V2_9MICC
MLIEDLGSRPKEFGTLLEVGRVAFLDGQLSPLAHSAAGRPGCCLRHRFRYYLFVMAA